MGKRTTKVPTKDTVKRRTIADMKALGVHKPQYNRLIDIYAGLVEQYLTLVRQFVDSKYDCEVSTNDGGVKKAPIVATLENLRKDILAYSDRLCLNPKALETVTAEVAEKSRLARVLSELR